MRECFIRNMEPFRKNDTRLKSENIYDNYYGLTKDMETRETVITKKKIVFISSLITSQPNAFLIFTDELFHNFRICRMCYQNIISRVKIIPFYLMKRLRDVIFIGVKFSFSPTATMRFEVPPQPNQWRLERF